MPDSIIPVGFPPRTRVYHLEHDTRTDAWRVWLAMPHDGIRTHSDQRYGTYLELWPNGSVNRVSRDEAGEHVMKVKGPSNEV